MKDFRYWRPLAVAAMLGASWAAHATNPPIRMAQGVEYMCGGKTPAEAAFMRMVAPRWAATLEFGVSRDQSDAVPAEVLVRVRERYTGKPVMEATTASPYMLARLQPGAYEVQATLAGITLEQPLIVFNGVPAKAAFVWPSNIDFAAAAAGDAPQQQAAARIE
ncbi:MAG: hypothetical protein KKC79_12970 [Gammaproteobacteria bacterium]|nr:hypothetical protein [Gammaproteobacteria bacterium]